jgi:hypothetical protein
MKEKFLQAKIGAEEQTITSANSRHHKLLIHTLLTGKEKFNSLL